MRLMERGEETSVIWVRSQEVSLFQLAPQNPLPTPLVPSLCVCVCVCVCVQLLQSCQTLCSPMDCSPPVLLCPWDSPGKNTGVGCHSLLQGIFLTQDPTCASCLSCIGRQIPCHWATSSLRGSFKFGDLGRVHMQPISLVTGSWRGLRS